MQTVQQLEQAALAGQAITPGQLAEATSTESAARRLDEISVRREENLAREAAKKEAAEINEREFPRFAEAARDSRMTETLAKIGELIVEYKKLAVERNETLQELRGITERCETNYRNCHFGFTTYKNSPSPAISLGDIQVEGVGMINAVDWERTLINSVQEAVASVGGSLQQ